MSKARIAVYVIHWRAPERLIAAVRSLERSSGVEVDLTVVDNASGAEILDAVRAALPDTRVLETGINLGYAGAANVALREARGRACDLLALAAHDVLVEPDTLRSLAEALVVSPSHAIVGPVLWDTSFDHAESVGGAYHPWSGGPLVAPQHAGRPDRNGIVESTFVSGSLMLIRPSFVEEIEGMDEQLFAYWEDVDLCLQARRLGHRVGVVVAARAAETGYSSSNRTHAYLIARNHLLVTRKHFGRVAFIAATGGVLLRSARAVAGAAVLTRPPDRRAASWDFAVGRWRGLRAGLLNRGGPPPLPRSSRRSASGARFE